MDELERRLVELIKPDPGPLTVEGAWESRWRQGWNAALRHANRAIRGLRPGIPMKKRERDKRNQRVADLLNRGSVELNLIRVDFERDYLTDQGALARIEAAFEPINEARRLLEGLRKDTEDEANGRTDVGKGPDH